MDLVSRVCIRAMVSSVKRARCIVIKGRHGGSSARNGVRTRICDVRVQWERNAPRLGRRAVVIATTSSVISVTESGMATAKSKPFEGRFADPNHPDGYRVVTVTGDKVSIAGKDEKTDEKEWSVVGTERVCDCDCWTLKSW